MKSLQKAALLAACGATAGIASAQPFVINIFGATLQEQFFIAPASTNDFIDVDGDSFTTGGGLVDQLALDGVNSSSWWQVHYRAVGSGNGIAELVALGGRGVYDTADEANGVLGTASDAYVNREFYMAGGSAVGSADAANSGFTPNRSTTDGTFALTNSTDPADSGVHTDLAPSDVPTFWFARVGDESTADFSRNPGDLGYGFNPKRSVDLNGLSADIDGDMVVDPDTEAVVLGGRNSQLRSLGALNNQTQFPDENTVFDNSIAYTPVAGITNFGHGMTSILFTEQQHSLLSGRLPNGWNIIQVTRDSGSGTHNAYISSFDIDPAHGLGENVGQRANSSTNDNAGPFFTPGNAGGSSRMEGKTKAARIGIGYTGAGRLIGDDLGAGRLETLLIIHDNEVGTDAGGTAFATHTGARPFIDNVVDNEPSNPNRWRVGGPAVLASVGDYTLPASDPVAIENQNAADYLDNFFSSLAALNAAPGGAATLFTPGEAMAVFFIAPAAANYSQDLFEPASWLPNPLLNTTVQSFTRATNTLADPAYNTFGTFSTFGANPVRTDGFSYTDGGMGSGYTAQDGSNLADGVQTLAVNGLSFDFDQNGSVTTADFVDAWTALTNRAAYAPGTQISIEIIGDLNVDGNYDLLDLRYAADGYVLTGGALDRAANFLALDNAAGGNAFGTTLANGSYSAGDARADVTNSSLDAAPGWQPWAADGVVDCFDITYITRQLQIDTITNSVEWADPFEAQFADLSADLTGDLVIDQADVDAIFAILGTSQGDINLDGVIDAADEAIVTGNLGLSPATYCQGDIDGDGSVGANDAAFFGGCVADLTTTGATLQGQPGFGIPDGTADLDDLGYFLGFFLTNDASVADVTTSGATLQGQPGFGVADGVVDLDDLGYYLNFWLQGCN
ncbi:MAG: GC-type dockerin domain-anchored protein [Planctomycetota bacterium]